MERHSRRSPRAMVAGPQRLWETPNPPQDQMDAPGFLASRVLQEKQPVTYRLLSRVLGVHVNQAKQCAPLSFPTTISASALHTRPSQLPWHVDATATGG